jgi:hypothetical protein
LALLPDFLVQASREAHIRVKSLGTAQQTINCRVTVLEALQREASEGDLATLGRRQSALESHIAIEAALSEVRRDLLGLLAARESANQTEREVTELATEVRSVRSGRKRWKSCSFARQVKSLHFFTGAVKFAVKEIEVFQIAD